MTERLHFLRKAELSQDELVKNIIGAIGALDAYQFPDAKGFTSMALCAARRNRRTATGVS